MTIASCCIVFASNVPTASACGGCFHGVANAQPTVVTGHRMAISVSPERTVLWDQVQYAGDPQEFAWVLPVGPGAYIEAASDAWFESLEAVTSTRVMSQAITCSNGQVFEGVDSGGGFGCGSSPMASSVAGSGSSGGSEVIRRGDDGVTVVHEGTVGPYETVTLKSDDPKALRSWLQTHNYDIPADIEPVIDTYVKAKSDFIALRLQPGAGVRQMTPVRVVTPGASPTLPLQMVSAGTGPEVDIVLYVISEGRYQASNFSNKEVDPTDLTWNWSSSSSNYSTLRKSALSGGNFLTTYAQRGAFNELATAPDGTNITYSLASGKSAATLADLYFAQAALNDGTQDACSFSVLDSQGASVVDGCPNPMDCTPPPNTIGKDALVCEGHDDLWAALVGMHPNDVWVTRLEATLPHAMLNKDLTLGAAPQQPIDNWLVAPRNNGSPCPAAVAPSNSPSTIDRTSCGPCSTGSGTRSPLSNVVVLSLGALSLTLFGRRRARRRR
jgi:hypothetical protein